MAISKKQIKDYLIITLGSLLIAASLYFFMAPAQLALGGMSGLSIVLKESAPKIPLGIIMLTLNTVMFVIGFLILGGNFGIKTIYSSLAIATFTLVFERLRPGATVISQDTLIVMIFGILLMGIGQAMIFNRGASSGGTDIVAKIITKFFPINIGRALLIADTAIICAAIGVFGIEKGLYALLGIIINGYLIDYLVAGFNTCHMVTIITSDIEPVKRYIIHELNRGATVYQAVGAYSNSERQVITTAVNRRQFIELKNFIAATDDRAFVTVQQLHAIMGEGFKTF